MPDLSSDKKPLAVAPITAALPRDPTQERLLEARVSFDQGDFMASRRTLELLLRSSPPEPVRAEIEELKSRLGTDKVALYLAMSGLVLFAVVALSYLH